MYTECAIAIENVHRMTRSHATIFVRRIRPDVREFSDKRMMGSEVAHRVRCGGITGEREGLAATAAEIELAARAACARLLHPCGAAEGIESWGIRPDICERMLGRSTMSPILSMLVQCTTAFTVSGSLCPTTAAASARFLANAPA